MFSQHWLKGFKQDRKKTEEEEKKEEEEGEENCYWSHCGEIYVIT